MPVRIIAGGKYVIIHCCRIQLCRQFRLSAVLDICKMNRSLDFASRRHILAVDSFFKITDCLCTVLIQRDQAIPVALSCHTVVRLVSDLNHAHIDTRVMQCLQALQCKIVQCLRFIIQREMRPFLWCLLLGRICPEIGIVEVNQHAKSRVTCQFSDGFRSL